MHARCITMQEIKAHRCERPGCQFMPKYQVVENNSHGVSVSIYLCDSHYADLLHSRIKERTPELCELCGNTDTHFFDSPKFDDPNPNRIYRVCGPCKRLQEKLAAEEFEEDTAPEIDIDNRDLDDSKYEEF